MRRSTDDQLPCRTAAAPAACPTCLCVSTPSPAGLSQPWRSSTSFLAVFVARIAQPKALGRVL